MPYKKSERLSKWEKAIKALSKKKKSTTGVKTGTKKAPKYKGAPVSPVKAKSKLKGKLGAGKIPESVKERMYARGKFAKGGPIKGTYAERVAKQKAHREEMKRITSERRAAKKAAKAKKRLSKAGVKVSKETAAKSGKVRRGVKGAEVTKGGAYAKYGKKSKAAKSFRSAFAAAKGKDFIWDGRKYSGKKAEDKKKVAPKKTAPKAPPSKQKALETFATPEGEEKKQLQAGGIVPPPPPDPSMQPSISPSAPSYKKGGKVESNPYGWPSRDARNGGKK